MAIKTNARVFRTHIHSRLQRQFILFIVIALVMFGIVISDVISQGASIWLVIVGAIVGGLIGYALGWAFKISWHEDTKKVVQNADKLGFILIGIYIVVRIGGQQVLGEFVHGQMLAALLYSVIAGIMVGRVIALSRRVRKVLHSKKLF